MGTGDFYRRCDVCGDDSFEFTRLTPIGDGKYACPYDARGFHDSDLRGRNDLAALHPPIKPREHAAIASIIPLWRQSEADIFNLGTSRAGTGILPYRYLDVTNGDGEVIGTPDVRTVGWWVIYLVGLLDEDRRPLVWLQRAEAKLVEYADYLLTVQCGSPTEDTAISTVIGPTSSTQTEYGGFIQMEPNPTFVLGNIYSEDVGVCGLALLRAFQHTGNLAYQSGYRAAMTCLRRMQCGGKLTYNFATTLADGASRYDSGMWTHKLVVRDPSGLGGGGGGGGDEEESPVVTGLVIDGPATPPPISSHLSGVPSVGEGTQWFIPWSELPGETVAVRLSGYFKNDPGNTSTWTLRVGGSLNDSIVDGTVVVTLNSTQATEYRTASGTFNKPDTASILKLCVVSAGPDDFASSLDAYSIALTMTPPADPIAPGTWSGGVTQVAGGGITSMSLPSSAAVANELLLLTVSHNPGSILDVTSVGVTWDLVATENDDGDVYVSVYRAMPITNIAALGVTINFNSHPTRAAAAAASFANVDTTGVNGANAIVQSATAIGGTSRSLVTLSPFGAPNNGTFEAISWIRVSGVAYPGAGFSALSEDAAGTLRAAQAWKPTADTTADWTFSGTTNATAAIALELKHG